MQHCKFCVVNEKLKEILYWDVLGAGLEGFLQRTSLLNGGTNCQNCSKVSWCFQSKPELLFLRKPFHPSLHSDTSPSTRRCIHDRISIFHFSIFHAIGEALFIRSWWIHVVFRFWYVNYHCYHTDFDWLCMSVEFQFSVRSFSTF